MPVLLNALFDTDWPSVLKTAEDADAGEDRTINLLETRDLVPQQ